MIPQLAPSRGQLGNRVEHTLLHWSQAAGFGLYQPKSTAHQTRSPLMITITAYHGQPRSTYRTRCITVNSKSVDEQTSSRKVMKSSSVDTRRSFATGRDLGERRLQVIK
jgi:hypothetical protein